jgi:hypothetical protein
MFGIGTKFAKIIAIAILALGTGMGMVALSASARAGDGYWRHDDDDHYHRGYEHGRRFYHPRPVPYRYRGPAPYRIVIRAWRPYPYRPVIRPGFIAAPCQPVIGRGFDQFGRPAKVAATMCYDRFGNGYVVPGSERIIHRF